jgi:hypothetical protein
LIIRLANLLGNAASALTRFPSIFSFLSCILKETQRRGRRGLVVERQKELRRRKKKFFCTATLIGAQKSESSVMRE